MKKSLFVYLSFSLLAGCGGGNSNSDSRTELEGTWVYSSDGHPTGTTCSKDASGELGARVTYTFSKNKYGIGAEACSGSDTNLHYVFMSGRAGEFLIGDSFVGPGTPGYQLRTLDILDVHGNRYTSHRLEGNQLHIANKSEPGHDGMTPATRQISFESQTYPFVKQ